MKKRLAVTLAAVALSVVMSVPAYAGTWKYVNDQWKYQRGANKFAYKEWIEDNGNWYYMDNNGVMTTGWQQIDGQWYYMDQQESCRRAGLRITTNGTSCFQTEPWPRTQ